MIWYIISALAFALALGLLIRTRLIDRRYARLKGSQAMRPEILEELTGERDAAYARREHFKKALEDARSEPEKT